ncbi:MAG: biotin--[acetyl-CoA-carboxylase] ligase [bacterium]
MERFDERFIRDVFSYSTIDSTNTEAKRLIKSGKIRKSAMVISQRQTAGRGRGRHRWWSGQGSLAFTLVWEWDPGQELVAVPLVIGFACRNAAQELISPEKVYLKWPNDLMADNRKLGGVLCECDIDASNKNYLVVGVGINVNDLFSDAPDEIKDSFVSLAELNGSVPVDKERLLSNCLLKLKQSLVLYRRRGLAPFRGQWAAVDYLFGKKISLAVNDKTVSGSYAGISPSGGILIRSKGETKEFLVGEIIRISKS